MHLVKIEPGAPTLPINKETRMKPSEAELHPPFVAVSHYF
jgi:hypothetical protein